MFVFTFIAVLLSVLALAVEGSVLYDSKKEFCCDGAKFFRGAYASSAKVVCCSQIVKDYTASQINDPNVEEECCGGKFFPIQTDPNRKCCGDQYYDVTNSMCLKNEVIEVDPRNAAVGRVNLCGDDPKENSAFYRKGSEVCCDSKLSYDMTLDCCNGTLYNVTTQICCANFANLDDPDENQLVYATPEIPDFTIPISDYGCCNGQFMNRKTEVCCDSGPRDTEGAQVKECCGEKFLCNTTIELCVNKEIIPREPYQDACKEEPYNTTNQYCYKGKVIDLEKGQDYCESVEEPYYINTQLCCPDGIFNKTDDAQNKCCFRGVFDY